MPQNKPYLEYYDQPLSATSQLAVRVAEERAENMRNETVESQRENQYNFSHVRIIPPRVHVTPVEYKGVPCEWVQRRIGGEDEERVILYLHGGSWIFGCMNSARPVGVLLVEATQYRCLMVDYRLAPEHKFPAGLEDCYKVYMHLIDEGLSADKIGLFGDSAGGNLSLALINRLKLEGKPLPACVGLASPVTDMREDSGLVTSNDNLIYTNYDDKEWDIFSLYLDEEHQKLRGLPSISPITANLVGLPPVLIHTGSDEPLVEDNISYAEKFYSSGGNIKLKIWDEMFHDFTIVGKTLRESRISMREMGRFFIEHMG